MSYLAEPRSYPTPGDDVGDGELAFVVRDAELGGVVATAVDEATAQIIADALNVRVAETDLALYDASQTVADALALDVIARFVRHVIGPGLTPSERTFLALDARALLGEERYQKAIDPKR